MSHSSQVSWQTRQWTQPKSQHRFLKANESSSLVYIYIYNIMKYHKYRLEITLTITHCYIFLQCHIHVMIFIMCSSFLRLSWPTGSSLPDAMEPTAPPTAPKVSSAELRKVAKGSPSSPPVSRWTLYVNVTVV